MQNKSTIAQQDAIIHPTRLIKLVITKTNNSKCQQGYAVIIKTHNLLIRIQKY